MNRRIPFSPPTEYLSSFCVRLGRRWNSSQVKAGSLDLLALRSSGLDFSESNEVVVGWERASGTKLAGIRCRTQVTHSHILRPSIKPASKTTTWFAAIATSSSGIWTPLGHVTRHPGRAPNHSPPGRATVISIAPLRGTMRSGRLALKPSLVSLVLSDIGKNSDRPGKGREGW